MLPGTTTIQQWGDPVEILTMGTPDDHAVVAGHGTIRFIPLEGGFYGIEADDGSHYYPINLDAVYRVDGTRIAFSADLSDDATIAMWGFPVHITAIQDLGPCTVFKG